MLRFKTLSTSRLAVFIGSSVLDLELIWPLMGSAQIESDKAIDPARRLSVLDGRWIEGCIEGVTDWAIDGVAQSKEGENRTRQDAQSLYQKFGQVVLPAFYQQRDDLLRIMCHAIALNASHFNTQRMVQ